MHHHKASKLEGQNLSICAGLELNNKASHVLADQTLRNVSIQLGASEATEGATGLYRQYQGQGAAGFNPVRSGLNAASPVWGDTIYDTTYLGLSVLALGAPVPLKVGASDGINRANSMFGVTVPRWQNPIINPLTNNVLLPSTAAQGVLVYGVSTKVPVVVEDVNKVRGGK